MSDAAGVVLIINPGKGINKISSFLPISPRFN